MFLVLVGIFYENSWHGLLLRFWLLQFPAGEGFNCTRDRVHRWFSRASCSAPDRVPALRSLPDKASLRNFGNRPGRCRAISRHPAPESPEGPSHAQTAPGRSPLHAVPGLLHPANRLHAFAVFMHQLVPQRTAALHRVIPPHPVEPEQIVVRNPVGIGKNFCNLRMVLFYRIGSCCRTVESNSGLIRFMVVIGIPVGS